MTSHKIGFLGAGGIARAHAYALAALSYYYPDAPAFEKVVVASPTPASRESFAKNYGFQDAIPPEAIWERKDLDTLYILGPNPTHTPQLLKACQLQHIQNIYVEKPIGIAKEDIRKLEEAFTPPPEKTIMMGFQFLQKSPIRKALAHWQTGVFGEPFHFRAEYHHSSYLDESYREKRKGRLIPIPQNGAAVDLGTHVLSMLTAFLGNDLTVLKAVNSGHFEGVPAHSDLCTTVLMQDQKSGAVGTLVASRVTPGSGDDLTLELMGKKGTLTFSTVEPDVYKTYLPEHGWQTHHVMSDYLPDSKFPSIYMPTGWLRAMVHAHYLFLKAEAPAPIFPDVAHGIQVQRLVQQIAEDILAS